MDDQARDREDTEVRTRRDDDDSDRGQSSADEVDRRETTAETDGGRAFTSETTDDSRATGEDQQSSTSSDRRTEADDDGGDRGDQKEATTDDDVERSETTSDADDGGAGSSEASDAADDDEERRVSADEFAKEHDPAGHDIAAGEDARQPGDWTAEEAGGPQVWDADGNLVEGSGPGAPMGDQAPSDGDQGDVASDGRRASELDEVQDGGYGVGSAASIDDGAMPLGHPVKAWEDTKTFVSPDHSTYGDADPHLWFTDAEAAQNAGFRHVE